MLLDDTDSVLMLDRLYTKLYKSKSRSSNDIFGKFV